ncbi:MAG: ROK family protein [Clostridiaceae bacterium]
MEKFYVIGIDLGGTKINAVVSDNQGTIISQKLIKTEANLGEISVLNKIIGIVDDLLEENVSIKGEIKAIGIGSPGPLDPKKGVIIRTPNLPFVNFNLAQPIKEKFNVPVFLDNDCNAAAIGEYYFGAGKETTDMIYVTISTGVGAGAILDGRIYRGKYGNALEFGHTTIIEGGPRCNCGNYGDVEVLSSGTAIARQAREKIKEGAETSLRKYENPTTYEVYLESKNGDKVSSEILDKSFTYFGTGIANIINMLDPEMIVIGGGVTNVGNILFDKVGEVVRERSLNKGIGVEILPAKLGQNAGVLGAVGLALMELKAISDKF